jgi:transcriptional regulator with XRE-family HTH domain
MAENIDLAYLAERLRTSRKERGKTLQDVANDVDVSVATLSRIERGEARGVDGETLLALAKWLDLPADHLSGKPRMPSLPPGVQSSSASTPDVIELHLRADPKLNSKTAKALATMFRIAYEQMADQKKTKSGG